MTSLNISALAFSPICLFVDEFLCCHCRQPKHVRHNSLPTGCCWRHISGGDNAEEKRMQRPNSGNNPLAIMGPLPLLWQMAGERMQTFIFNTRKRRRLGLREVFHDFIDSAREVFLQLTCLFFQHLKSSSTTSIIVFNGPKRRPRPSPIINICHHDKHLFKQQIRCYMLHRCSSRPSG